MKLIILLLSISALFLFDISYAQETITYEEFIRRLPNLSKERKEDCRTSPELRNLVWGMINGLAARTLAQLGYGTGPFHSEFSTKERTAVESFQKELNLPITGSLDSLTLAHLAEAEDFFIFKTINLPSKIVWVNEKTGSAGAMGTWKAVNYKDAWPFNTQSMSFTRSTMTCEVSDTHIQWDRDEFLLNSDKFMQTFLDVYAITRWDDEFIIAENEAMCTKSVISVNIKSEDVTFTRYTTRTDGECSFMDKEPAFTTLVSGTDLRFDKRWDKYKNILIKNSDATEIKQEFENLLEKLENKGKK